MRKHLKKYRFFMIALWALCLFAVLPFGNVRAAAVKPSCTKTKTVYFQKQTFRDPMTRKNIVSYDLLGTGELALGNLSSKAVITNLKSSNRHMKQNRKTYRLSCKVTFRTDFVKSAELGALDLTRKLNQSTGAVRIKTAQKKARLLITLPSDYKVVSIRYNYKGQETGPVWKTAKKLQNGGVFPIGKDTVLMVEYAPKSGKSLYNRSYILHINRV